ncbi:TlpA disulfide reductase family protein [Ramlibacter sp.]|uniref:TlpA disulfide reductase family protein n=1 Tax=Ramlibacter sp. TaxID=1917967 RepID=UPI0039C9EDA5
MPAARSRRALLAGAGAAALLAGGAAAWWRLRVDESAGSIDALWPLSFRTPEGATLAMAGFRGKSLLVNFWATWCPPCIDELPLLDGFYREHASKGWQVVGLAIDQPSAVRAFLQHTPVAFPVGLAGLQGTELTKTLGNEVGGLPFSVFVDASGKMRERRIGRLSRPDLDRWFASG